VADDGPDEEGMDKRLWLLVIPGILLIPFGMAVIWKNERKIVRITGVLRHGKKMLKPDCSSSPSSSNDMELVHATGITTAEEISDGHYSRDNVYYIRADVEMYQKIEHKRTVHHRE